MGGKHFLLIPICALIHIPYNPFLIQYQRDFRQTRGIISLLSLKLSNGFPSLTPVTIPNCYYALKDSAKIWGLTSMTLLRPCHLVFQSFKEIPVLGLLHLLFLTHGRNFICPPSFSPLRPQLKCYLFSCLLNPPIMYNKYFISLIVICTPNFPVTNLHVCYLPHYTLGILVPTNSRLISWLNKLRNRGIRMEKQQKTNFSRNARYFIYAGAQTDLRGCLCAPKSFAALKMGLPMADSC